MTLFLFILEFFNVATFAFGGSARTTITFFEGVLAYKLYALVFFLWSTVDEVVIYKLSPYPVA